MRTLCSDPSCAFRVRDKKGRYTPCPVHGERSEIVGPEKPDPAMDSGVENRSGGNLGTGTITPHRCDATCYKNTGDRKMAF